ncbi:hypothetical protein EVAR_54166_1 [Eumeta japonica]|uniref:Uncharacterized protein n=1 Tax=Eumeta variegata TaxID=151549 RepID=A0A4C1Y3U8_EUMVA|nr:hypothetical protein EVAR_54166_1 [Eumeta japonica]
MDTRSPKEVINALPTSWITIGYLRKKERIEGGSAPPELSLTNKKETAETIFLSMLPRNLTIQLFKAPAHQRHDGAAIARLIHIIGNRATGHNRHHEQGHSQLQYLIL